MAAFWFAGEDNPVAGPLLRHLRLHCATSRITSALTVTAWLHALQHGSRHPPTPAPDSPSGSTPSPQSPTVPQDVVQALFGCLAQPAVAVTAEGTIQPYAELTSVYSAMQTQAQVLNHVFCICRSASCRTLDILLCLVLTKLYALYCSHQVAGLSTIVLPCILLADTHNCSSVHQCPHSDAQHRSAWKAKTVIARI